MKCPVYGAAELLCDTRDLTCTYKVETIHLAVQNLALGS